MESIKSKRSVHLLASNGFTMVELLITMVVSSLIMISVFGAYKAQQNFSLEQEQITEMQQNIRAGMNALAREARYAGYDPNGKGYEIQNAERSEFQFTMDNDDGGSYTREFSLYDPADKDSDDTSSVRMTAGGSALANNIERLEFEYLDEDNNIMAPVPIPAGQRDDIRSLRIYMLARADNPDNDFSNTITYALPSGNYTPPGDNYRRRLQIMTVKLRNMGL